MAMTASTMLPLGTTAPAFALPCTVTGATVSNKDYAGKPLLVMFLCNHCPFVKHLNSHLAKMCAEFQEDGLGIVAISSNDINAYPDDAPDKMKEEAQNIGYTFPYLFDETQEVAKSYHAACTPDFFLFDRDHKLVYRGRYDETRPDSGAPNGKELCAALEAVLANDPPLSEQKPSMGCNIKWIPGNEPEYYHS